MTTREPESEKTRIESAADQTRLAGDAYQPQSGAGATRVAQEGYQSILASRGAPSPPEEAGERFKIGDRIDGRYEVLAIHRGSMGIVYGTFDHIEKLPRALKTLQQRFASDWEMRKLFAEEAAVWVRLEKHPFIVRAYKVGWIESKVNQAYVTTEYIRGKEGMGGDLRAWLGHPRLTLAVAIEMALQIAQGMHHAARKVPGLVHRDLKPANVLVDDRGRALVTDFGLVCAKEVGAGTPTYMAPEQWRGAEVDQRADIYAYGCILYEMLTGHRMYAARTVQEWKAAHLGQRPVSLRSLKDVPADLEEFVFRCLAKDGGARPESWDEVVEVCALWFHRLTGQPTVMDFSAYQLSADELLQASYSLGELGKDPEMLEVCDRVLAINPNYAPAWHYKGVALEKAGDAYDDEYRHAQLQAISDNNFTASIGKMSEARLKLKRSRRWEEALGAFDHALALAGNPDEAKTWLCKGLTLEKLERWEEALGAFDHALAINPNEAWAWLFKGTPLQKLERGEEALVAYDHALAINPEFVNAWRSKGLALESLGRPQQALQAYDSALAVDPNDGLARYRKEELQQQKAPSSRGGWGKFWRSLFSKD